MSVKLQSIKIGTRGSPLALRQTALVSAALKKAAPHVRIETVVIKTSGDWRPAEGETPLAADRGGKALFAKEIEETLLQGKIDAGVHSMKDMETALPEGLFIPCMLPREDARDALLLHKRDRAIRSLADLPGGIIIGTSSVRRAAFLRRWRPDVEIVPLRGNVEMRISKVRAGQVDATFLALAGLKRLELGQEADMILEAEDMLPAAGQGAVGIEARRGDSDIASLLSLINCPETLLRVEAERAVLKELQGSCRTPIGAYAVFEKESALLHLRAMASAGDGEILFEEDRRIAESLEEVIDMGTELGARIKRRWRACFCRGGS
jgi:hydroxymethylbilane synthase